MHYYVSIATDPTGREVANRLLREVYLRDFELDFDRFHKAFPMHFFEETLLIRDESGCLLATLSMLQPNGKLFPSEYIFGADIREKAELLTLQTSIEVGHLAKAKNFEAGLSIPISMIATREYLKHRQRSGWVATVRSPLYRILTGRSLDHHLFELKEERHGEQAECVERYKGGGIRVFWASANATEEAFNRMEERLGTHQVHICF